MGNVPVMGIDPDGNFAVLGSIVLGKIIGSALIGAGINAAAYTTSVAFSSGGFSNWSWGQFGNAVGMGALSGAATAGIGQAFGSVGSIGKELGRASAHALSSGGISRLGGGDFWQGAAAGFIGSGTGSLLHNAKPHWQIAGSALSGGLGAELGGGDFLQGAAFGGIVAGANHLAHRMQTNGGIDRVFDKWLARSRRVGRTLRKLNSIDRIRAFKKLVETNGIYDLKNSSTFKNDLRKHLRLEDGVLLPRTFSYRGKGGYKLEDLGNYNFGVLSNAAGYSNNFVQFGAGIYQIYSGTSSSRWWFSSIGSQLLYGDQPRDAYFIQLGFHHLWN